MATLLELDTLISSGDSADLRRKLKTAIAIKANAIVVSASPTAVALAWAKEALANPSSFENVVLNTVLAVNAASTVAQIASASDTAIQNAVNNVVDKLLAV